MHRIRNAGIASAFLLIGAAAGWSAEISLDEAIIEAGLRNPAIQASEWDLRKAEFELWEARGALFPGVVAQAEYTRHEYPTLVEPMREQPGPAAPELAFDDEIYSGAVRLTVPIVNLPAIAGVDGAQAHVAVRRAGGEKREQLVLARVTEVFVQAAQLDDSLMLLHAHIAALERRAGDLRVLEAEGRVTAAEVAVVEKALDLAESELLELRHHRDTLATHLGELLGREEAIAPSRSRLVPADLPDNDRPGGPELRRADADLTAAEAAKRGARYSFAPSLDGFLAQTARSGADRDFATEWSAGLSVTIPLLTGGERVARLKSSDAGVKAAQNTYESARLSELSALHNARSRWENAGRRRQLIERAIHSQERIVTAAQDRYDEGRAPVSELLDEETTLLELRMQERRLLYDQLLAFVSFHKTGGTLSPETVTFLIEN